MNASETPNRSLDKMNVAEEPAEEFICPISMEIMTSPVMILTTKMVYDNESLQTWFQQGGTTCPLTGTKLEFPLTLRPQLKLRSAIEAWAAENGVELAAPVYGKPVSLAKSGTFVTKQAPRQRVFRILKSIGNFLVSKRPFDCQLY